MTMGQSAMHWEKLGIIYWLDRDSESGSHQEFAQAPQAIVLSHCIRIYFSTRTRDAADKYISRIAYVEMTHDFKTILSCSRHMVVEPGSLGSFDEHGIFPMTFLQMPNAIWGYTTGWSRRVSVSVETAIGLVVSDDGGYTFKRISDGPVLGPSRFEPFLVGDGTVQQVGDTFHMWYIFGTAWRRPTMGSDPERTYKIGHAISTDGLNWIKDEARQIVADRLGAEEAQAMPTVVLIDSRYHMFFCYRESFDFRIDSKRGYRIGHAWSDNLIDWIRDDENPHFPIDQDSWDSQMQCYPHAFELHGNCYLLYNGNEFGRYGFGVARLVNNKCQ